MEPLPHRVATKEELRRLTRHRRWEWKPGMVVRFEGELLLVAWPGASGKTLHVREMVAWPEPFGPSTAPVLICNCTLVPTHPGTHGHLLSMLIDFRGGMVNRAIDMLDEAWHEAASSHIGDLLALVLLEAWEG